MTANCTVRRASAADVPAPGGAEAMARLLWPKNLYVTEKSGGAGEALREFAGR